MDEICRSCLEPKKIRMYHLEEEIVNVDVTLAKMLEYCTSKEIILEDGWPNFVCPMCFKIIRIAYNFLKQFQESQDILEKKIESKDLTCERVETKEIQDIKNVDTIEIVNVGDESSTYDFRYFHNYSGTYSNTNDSEESEFDEDETKILEANDINLEDRSSNLKQGDTSVELSSEEVVQYYMEDSNDQNDSIEDLEHQMLQEEKTSESIDETENQQMKNFSNDDLLANYKCPLCNYSTKRIKTFTTHLFGIHKQKKIICNKCKSKEELTIEEYVQHYRDSHRYHCIICQKNLSSRFGYSYHMSLHTAQEGNGEKFKCPYEDCQKEFILHHLFKRHLKSHAQTKIYHCEHCNKNLNSSDALRYHVRVHSGVQNFLCSLCGQTFSQACHLRDHMYKHAGHKRFKCEFCKVAAFITKRQLRKHIRSCSKKIRL